MVEINLTVGDSIDTINLGRRGENEATEVVFDISSLIETYGEGSATLLAKRYSDESSYPVSVTQEDSTVTWVVNNADTAYQGYGKAELYWYVGDLLAKTIVYLTFVGDDIGDEGEVPEAQQSWVESLISDMNELLTQANTAVTNAQTAQEAAETAATNAQTILASAIKIDSNGNFYI